MGSIEKKKIAQLQVGYMTLPGLKKQNTFQEQTQINGHSLHHRYP